jgi:hypothetical protein
MKSAGFTTILLSASVHALEQIVIGTDLHFKGKVSGLSYVFHGHNVVVKLPPYLPITDYFDS